MVQRKTTNSSINRSASRPAGRPVTQGVQSRRSPVMASKNFAKLTPEQRVFANQLVKNQRAAKPIMGATNTANIMAKPEFLELLPIFVQKLLITDVFGSVAMNSRAQYIPYLKFIADNTKGETKAGDVLASPFVNRQGLDPNFTGRTVITDVKTTTPGLNATEGTYAAPYYPILPGSIKITDKDGKVHTEADGSVTLTAPNTIKCDTLKTAGLGTGAKVEYQYDNENVGGYTGDGNIMGATATAEGIGYNNGARMGKGYLALDDILLEAETHQLACYTSIYAAFSAKQEYGASLSDIAKEAAFGEITAEINSAGFKKLKDSATVNPQFDWDASPVLSSAVVPSDYLNMLKLKLNEAASSVYKTTGLARPNRIVCGTTAAEYISMIYSFEPAAIEDTVGPYRRGKLDQFEVFVDPFYDVNEWVMCCKSDDIRRNSAIFGEYMPLTATDPITLANGSVQQGYATMYSMKVVNPATVLSGKILGAF